MLSRQPAPAHAAPALACEPLISVDEPAQAVAALIAGRRNVSPRRLVEPGPGAAQLEALWLAASAAPDHGQLTPWRFICVPAERRRDLGEAFASALVERDPGAGAESIEAAREKATRAPWLALAVADLRPAEPDIPAAERLISLGCAIQNLLLTAHALGLGSSLTSGQAMRSHALRTLFGLQAGEEAVCFVNIGTVAREKPPRIRPNPARFVSSL